MTADCWIGNDLTPAVFLELAAQPGVAVHDGQIRQAALELLSRVILHRSIAIVLSDFLEPGGPGVLGTLGRGRLGTVPVLGPAALMALRQANRRHDVVAVHLADRYELELPALGRLVLKDAETGEVLEINTHDPRKRAAFARRQAEAKQELLRLCRSAGIDSVHLRTDQPYATALGRFFEMREKRRLHGIRASQKAGIVAKMITGDHALTAAAIGRQCE